MRSEGAIAFLPGSSDLFGSVCCQRLACEGIGASGGMMLTTLPRPAAPLFGCGALRMHLSGLLCYVHVHDPVMQAQPGLAAALRAESDALRASVCAGQMLCWTDPVGWPAAGNARTEEAPADAEDEDDVSAHRLLSGSAMAPFTHLPSCQLSACY